MNTPFSTDTAELSVEFFPPQTPEGVEKLRLVRRQLATLNPDFYSITFGAGGTTRDRTFSIAQEVKEEGIPVAPHLSCVGSTGQKIREILKDYQSAGIRHIVALRGDLPSGLAEAGEFRHASELIDFIREETGDYFHIKVAAYPEWHPQARHPRDDLAGFVKKVKSGADSAITQYFYNADAYFSFVEDVRAQGLDIPVIPGVMPINNFSKLAHFSHNCGADIPRWMRWKFEELSDDADAIRKLGLDIVTNLCERLLAGGAPGLHFFSMNQSPLILEICSRLNISG